MAITPPMPYQPNVQPKTVNEAWPKTVVLVSIALV